MVKKKKGGINKMKKYEVGKVYSEIVGHTEGCYFDIADDGATLAVYFNRPTAKEIENFKSDKKFEIRLLDLSDTIMFLVKFGSLNWMDAPYTPHLSRSLTNIETEQEKGLATTIMLFDTSTGRLEALRLVGFSERFTDKIEKNVENLLKRPFDKGQYGMYLNMLFSRYSTDDFVKMATPGFKIN